MISQLPGGGEREGLRERAYDAKTHGHADGHTNPAGAPNADADSSGNRELVVRGP